MNIAKYLTLEQIIKYLMCNRNNKQVTDAVNRLWVKKVKCKLNIRVLTLKKNSNYILNRDKLWTSNRAQAL